MATRASTRPKVAYQHLSHATGLTMTFEKMPMFAIPLRYRKVVPSGTGRAAAHTYCREHDARISTLKFCPDCDGITTDTYSGYEAFNGAVVEVDTKALESAKDKQLVLRAMVDFDTIDPIYFEDRYEIDVEPGLNEGAFDQFVSGLRAADGKVAVGTVVVNKATKVAVLRWSEVAQALVMHTCTYDARIAWDELALIKAGRDARGADVVSEEAATLIEANLADEFDFASVADTYGEGLDEAIAAAAQGLPAPVRAAEPEPTPVTDLMAALRQSVDAAGAKKKPAAKKPAAKKKVAA